MPETPKPQRDSVAAVIRREDGRVLMLQRGATAPHYPLHWGPVTGFIEAGETAAEAALREIQEELHAAARLLRDGPPFLVDVGEMIVNVHPILCALDDPGAIWLNHENVTHAWMTIPEALAQQTIASLDEDFRRLGLLAS